jgi:hypothetical protein
VTHSYLAYGITLRSEIPIPGLQQASKPSHPTDLHFYWGVEQDWVVRAKQRPCRPFRVLPAEKDTTDATLCLTEYGEQEYFRFLYSDGTEFVLDASTTRIWGTCPAPLVLEDLTTYLVGPVMGFVLRRRGVTPLHACAVEIDGGAVVLCGAGGAGKSTMAAALALRGVPILCEDVTPLTQNDGEFSILPGYPRVCLWPDSVELLLGSRDVLPRITPTWEKRFLALNVNGARFADAPKKLCAIYFLEHRTEEPGTPHIEEMKPGDALLRLVQNTYMNQLLFREQRAMEFDVLSRVAVKVPFRSLIPNKSNRKDANLAALCELLLKDASQFNGRGSRATPSSQR